MCALTQEGGSVPGRPGQGVAGKRLRYSFWSLGPNNSSIVYRGLELTGQDCMFEQRKKTSAGLEDGGFEDAGGK